MSDKNLHNALIRPQSEGGLRESEERYHRLFESARDGIFLVDFDTGVITDANQFIMDRLGYSLDELLDKHLWEVGFLKDADLSKDAFLQLQDQGYIRNEDLPLEGKAGKRLEVEFASNVHQAGGRKVIQCNIRDITERKRTGCLDKKPSVYAIVNCRKKAVKVTSFSSYLPGNNVSCPWTAKCACPVVPLFVFRKQHHHNLLFHFGKLLHPECHDQGRHHRESLRPYVAAYVAELEAASCRFPLQFYVFEDVRREPQ